MRKKINDLIPLALDAVEIELKEKDGKIASQYNGYISSLGSGLVQGGLLPTLAFYTNLQSKSEKDRLQLMKAIYRVVAGIKGEQKLEGDELLKMAVKVQDNVTESYFLKDQIRNAAVAIKLSIRTFKLDKREEKAIS